MDPVNVSAKFAVRSFSRSWDNSDCTLWVKRKLGHFYFYCNFGKCGPISI